MQYTSKCTHTNIDKYLGIIFVNQALPVLVLKYLIGTTRDSGTKFRCVDDLQADLSRLKAYCTMNRLEIYLFKCFT